MTDARKAFLVTLSKVLLRCWILGFALLLLAFVMVLVAGEFIDDIHGRTFGLTPHEMDLILYCWLGALKLFVLVLFFMPWLAVRWLLRTDSRLAA